MYLLGCTLLPVNTPQALTWRVLQACNRSAAETSRSRGNKPGGFVNPSAKKVLFHLPCQILTRLGIGKIEPVFVDQHGLVLFPHFKSFFADILKNAFSQLARVGTETHSFGFFFEINTLHHSSHDVAFLEISRVS